MSYPKWVQTIRHFYREFPRLVREHYSKLCKSVERQDLEQLGPMVWKTVGDEIIMCCRLRHLEHLAVSVQAFLKAVESFGKILDGDGGHLDVKGAGWVAAFPAPNVTVALQETSPSVEQFDEAFESAADLNPASVDFLGNSIDCGFRLSGRATCDRFVVSVELAWLLSEACHQQKFNGSFRYHDREILRGVLKDRPYPVVSIETERSAQRREVLEAERGISGVAQVENTALRNFLKIFMHDEEIDLPELKMADSHDLLQPPKSYRDFAEGWKKAVAELQTQSQDQVAAETSADTDGLNDLPDNLEEQLDLILKKLIDSKWSP